MGIIEEMSEDERKAFFQHFSDVINNSDRLKAGFIKLADSLIEVDDAIIEELEEMKNGKEKQN